MEFGLSILNQWLKLFYVALAYVAQLVELQPMSRKVTGLIPGQGTCLGCGFGPSRSTCERQLINVSMFLSHIKDVLLPSSLSFPSPLSHYIKKSFFNVMLYIRILPTLIA